MVAVWRCQGWIITPGATLTPEVIEMLAVETLGRVILRASLALIIWVALEARRGLCPARRSLWPC